MSFVQCSRFCAYIGLQEHGRRDCPRQRETRLMQCFRRVAAAHVAHMTHIFKNIHTYVYIYIKMKYLHAFAKHADT